MADDGERARLWEEDLKRVREKYSRRRAPFPPVDSDEDPEERVEALEPMKLESIEDLEFHFPRKVDVVRPLNLAFNLVPGSNRQKREEKQGPPPPTPADVLENALGERAATEFWKKERECEHHIDMLDAFLMMPSSGDDLQPRLTAASGLMAALDPYMVTIARAGVSAEGVARSVMLELCAKHDVRKAVLQRMTKVVAEAAAVNAHLFITGEYER